ncbi:MAG: hypothetical protein QNJ54_04100 [Prochloraceae cyanobacterium]|nr:hypothetical protein [Prochloraceae cyanobacterium]
MKNGSVGSVGRGGEGENNTQQTANSQEQIVAQRGVTAVGRTVEACEGIGLRRSP